MKSYRLLIIAFAAFLSSLTFLAVGQTGRIAHFSHGGSMPALATTAATEDNFGLVVSYRGEKITRVNDSVAVLEGRQIMNSIPSRTTSKREIIYRPANSRATLTDLLQQLHEQYPEAVLIGFDKIVKPNRKKSASRSQLFPQRPFQYSYWRGLSAVAALGAVGWLLGKKRAA